MTGPHHPGDTRPLVYYSTHSIMSDPRNHAQLFDDLPTDLAALCQVVQGLLIHPFGSFRYGVHLTNEQKKALDIRPVSEMLALIHEWDDRPLTVPREPKARMAGNCRDFALFFVAMLRHRGLPARMRVGFGTYLGPGMNYDHFVPEYWDAAKGRWVLVDPEYDEVQLEGKKEIDFDLLDVPRDRFIIAGKAWQMCRSGEASPNRFGFSGKLRGMPYIRGSIVQDLVSLNKVEVLPWDTWWELANRGTQPLAQEMAHLDHLAALTIAGDEAFAELRATYEDDPLLHGPVLSRFADLIPEEERNTPAPHPTTSRITTLLHPRQSSSNVHSTIRPPAAAATRQSAIKRVSRLEPDKIVVRGAQQHNLKNIDVSIPRYKLVVLTGVSGSGKSSLAFDTIYAEGQRRYVESLSPYVRRFLEKVEKPKVDFIGGLSPAISIEQKTVSKNPRSTVGSVTEVNDYLRLLYSRIGTAHCLTCKAPIEPLDAWEIANRLTSLPPGSTFELVAPVHRHGKGLVGGVLEDARKQGYKEVIVDGNSAGLGSAGTARLKGSKIELPVARLTVPAAGDDREEFKAHLVTQASAALRFGNGVLTVRMDGEEAILSDRRVCAHCGTAFPELSSGHFSPNSPLGMCSGCNGLGTKLEVDPALIVADPTRSILDGALRWYGELRKKKSTWSTDQLRSIAEHYKVDLEQPWQDLPETFRHVLLYGSGEEKITFRHNSESDEESWSGQVVRPVRGVIFNVNRGFRETKSESARRWYASFMSRQPCPTCEGTRLGPEARVVTLGGKTLTEVGSMPLDVLLDWVDGLYTQLDDERLQIAGEALKEVRERLQFMLNVGLHYLTLDRPAPTLSGGEGQRIRLASQLGCGLVGVLYVLDEPSIGLHARDQRTLLDTLLMLRDMGNTVLVVEHDADTMRSADWLIDLGPGAGILGGEVVAAGAPDSVAADPKSLTGRYLSGELQVTSPNLGHRRDPGKGWLKVRGARLHNLKDIDAGFPLGLLTCVTGVSGGGKSSLIAGTLYPALVRALHDTQVSAGPHDRIEGLEGLNKVINITQDPIGRTPRSNPATYVGVYDDIRKLFAETAEARARRYGANRFSFNVKGGRCESCKGHGQNVVQMHFLPDVWVTCKECGGARYNRDTLAIRYRGKNISEVLDMDVQEALAFFSDHKVISRTLGTLHDVGLDYLKLGQSATTLSGGEAQRVKLAKELSRVSTGRTLYILDEPTTGLHFADIQRLLDVLHRLVDAGNTVVVIEHNMDVIKTADWIIDLGPEGGDAGGRIVAEGTPEEVAKAEASYTGHFLREILFPSVEGVA